MCTSQQEACAPTAETIRTYHTAIPRGARASVHWQAQMENSCRAQMRAPLLADNSRQSSALSVCSAHRKVTLAVKPGEGLRRQAVSPGLAPRLLSRCCDCLFEYTADVSHVEGRVAMEQHISRAGAGLLWQDRLAQTSLTSPLGI